jgi:drug/metabolite transporter (DMT)-like permease
VSSDVAERRALAAWAAVCVLWGTTYLAIRLTLDSLPPLATAGIRHLTAGLLLAGILTARDVSLPSASTWPRQLLLGLLMLGFGNGGVVWGEQWVPTGMAAMMVAAIPFWVVGFEALAPAGERLRLRQFVGLVLGFAGIVLLVSSNLKPNAGVREFMYGVIALQFSCCGWALGSVYSKRHAHSGNVLAAAALQMMFGGLILILAGGAAGEWHPVTVTYRSGLAFLYLIVFGSLVGFVSYVYALKHLPVTTVALYAYVNPVIAVLLGVLVMREPFTLKMAAAVAIIFAGMVVVRQSAGTSRSSRAPA